MCLGGIDEDGELTKPLGEQMAELPISPTISKVIAGVYNFLKNHSSPFLKVIVSPQKLCNICKSIRYQKGQKNLPLDVQFFIFPQIFKQKSTPAPTPG